LERIGAADDSIVALDGDVKNSTYSDKFFKKFPDRSVECFIAEQNMVGVAVGMGT
jgi:transketolase